MITINRLILTMSCCWTISAWSGVPQEAPGCHPTIEETKADVADQLIARRGRESNMERRYERRRAEDLREGEPADRTLYNDPDPYFGGRTYLGSSPTDRDGKFK